VDVPGATKVDSRGREVLERQLDNAALAAEILDVNLRVNVVADVEAEFDRLYERILARDLQRTLDHMYFSLVLPVECGRAGCSVPTLAKRPFFRVVRRERAKAMGLGMPLEDLLPGSGRPCGATCTAFVLIGPDGSLYKCPNDLGIVDRAHGNVRGDVAPRPHKLLPWLTYDWFQYDECAECLFLPRCAGGCPHRRRFEYGGSYCLFSQEQLDLELPENLRKHALRKRREE
jgi:uncharacterized protein